jgi:type II secretory pathway component PulK
LSLDAAQALVAQRNRAYFRDRADFLRQLPQGALAATDDIAFGSENFMTTMRVTIDSAQARGTALLARGNPGTWPDIAWRKSP